MKVAVRPVRLDDEKNQLLDILQRNLPDLSHAGRFEWLYHKNPAGKPWAWFVCEEQSGKPVGVASVFPRWMWINGEPARCGQVGDFAIDSAYRSLGPAVLLQKATFGPVNESLIQFCYDCPPDDRGMSTFRRLGIDPNCRLHRFARPLRLERRLAGRLRNSSLASVAAFVGNLALLVRSMPTGTPAGLEIAAYSGQFDEEFTALDQRVGAHDSVRSLRSAEVLNWRFREDPLHRYSVLTARRQGVLVGFLIAFRTDGDAYVIDLFGDPLNQVGPPLLHFLAREERSARTQTLHALAESGGKSAEALIKGGFGQREASARIVAYSKSGTPAAAFLARRPHWPVTRMDLLA